MRTVNAFLKTMIEMPAPLRFYFEGLRYGVLDIETTGLSPQRNKLILGGLLYEDEMRGGVVLQQFFAEQRAEEAEVVQAYVEALSRLDCVFTYNGASFDLPFILKRAEIRGIDVVGKLPVNIDLYNIVDRYSVLRSVLPNLRQKTVEEYCGIADIRKDQISGGDSVKLYNRFCETQRDDLAQQILLHNADDVVQLSRLLPVTQKVDIHKAMAELGFGCRGKLCVTQIRVNKGSLTVKGKQQGKAFGYTGPAGKDGEGRITFDAAAGSFHISVPLIESRNMKVVDLLALRAGAVAPDFSILEKYPYCGSGYVAVTYEDKLNYREINHFIKVYIDCMMQEGLADAYEEQAGKGF